MVLIAGPHRRFGWKLEHDRQLEPFARALPGAVGIGTGSSVIVEGRLSWEPGLRHDEVYVHITGQSELDDRINALIDTR